MLPKVYRVELTLQAYEDLEGIRNYIAAHAPDTAADVIARILTECYELDVFPHRGIKRRLKKYRGNLRQMPVASAYRVLFSVNDESTKVIILRVQHGSRNSWR